MRPPKRRKLAADSLDPHPERARARRRRLPGISAWLVQWVSADVADRPLTEAAPRSRRRVAAILSPRISHDRVAEVANAIFLAEHAEPDYMLAVYRLGRESSRSPGASPVTPTYAMLEVEMDGHVFRGPFVGRFRIGRDPCLYARKVRNLREIADGTLDWDEIAMPSSPRGSEE